MSTYRQQAEEVECRCMEVRDHLEILKSKPDAARTLARVAEKDAERRAQQVPEAAE